MFGTSQNENKTSIVTILLTGNTLRNVQYTSVGGARPPVAMAADTLNLNLNPGGGVAGSRGSHSSTGFNANGELSVPRDGAMPPPPAGA